MLRFVINIFFILLIFFQFACQKESHTDSEDTSAWIADNGDGTYKNPIIFADYSDPDVIRVGKDFYMVSSSFNCSPGMPLLHSNDLVNWTIVGHVFDKQIPDSVFKSPQHGNGCWAPSIRYHNQYFWVYYGDPDYGIYMAKTKDPLGPWEPLVLVRKAKGWIDPCPLWDDDGQAYLVHAWAKSRAGFNSILTVHKMSSDGRQILDEGKMVFDGHENHPTIEGPKFYKRNGYYYIFAPAGGVKPGWQTILRSKNIYGPYEDKIVLEQGSTDINGPHQGGWVELESGESWFVHFQDRGAYGRVVHLQPVSWENDWPLIGVDLDGNGVGEPVLHYKKPDVGREYPVSNPQTSDEFENEDLGLQWQWQANYDKNWWSLSADPGNLRLYISPLPDKGANLWSAANLLLQKFPAPEFTVTTLIKPGLTGVDDKSGVIVMGRDYAYLAVKRDDDGHQSLVYCICKNAEGGDPETEEYKTDLSQEQVFLQVKVISGALCQFSYSLDGRAYTALEPVFKARPGKWIGAKIGLFASTQAGMESAGFADFDWFRIQ